MLFDLNDVVSWLLYYKYAILIPITIAEGPIITIIAGFLASNGFLNPFVVYGVVVIGDIVGDIIYYSMGRWGGVNFIKRWERFFKVKIETVENLEKHFEKHSGKTLLFGKLSHFIGAPILMAAGIVKMPLKKFISFNFWATLPKSLILLLIGYYFGEAYKQINEYFNFAAVATFIIIAVLIVGYMLLTRLGKKFEKDIDQANS